MVKFSSFDGCLTEDMASKQKTLFDSWKRKNGGSKATGPVVDLVDDFGDDDDLLDAVNAFEQSNSEAHGYDTSKPLYV